MGPIRLFKSNKHLSFVLAVALFFFLVVEWQLSTLNSQKSDVVVKKDFSALASVHEATNEYLPVVLYNRVPKSGSTTFTNLVYDVVKLNQIYVLHINTSGNSLKISLSDQISLAWNMTHWDAMKPAFYHGHFCYYSFSRFGLQNPHYINILREPLDRLVSHYYFLRYGDDYRKGLKRMRQGDTTTFDECLEQGGRECQPKQMWLQIPLMCGQTAECWKIGSTWALEEAKRNVMSSYTLVGVTERMDEFIEVLETILPRLFNGITEKYKEGTKSHIRKTLHKEPLSEKSLAFMKNSKVYRMERELYDFTVKHFDYIKKLLSDSNGQLFPSGKRFRYEKVYGPKGAIIK